jgi:putative spermidine/putrescine transport system permease protein
MTQAGRNRLTSALLVLPLVILICALLLYPMGLLLGQSLHGENGFSVRNYAPLFREGSTRTALFHSLLLSALVAFTSTFVCLAPAWLFANHQVPGQRIVRACFTLPMSFSGIIVGFLTIIMLGRIGVVPQLLGKLTGADLLSGSAYQLKGLVIAYLYFEIPRATLTLESALRKFDPQLSVAAKSLGANTWQRLRLLVFPLIWRPLLSTFAVTFTVSLGSFGVALIMAKRFSLLPLEIYQQITGYGNPALMAALAISLVTIAFLINYSVRVWSDAEARAT